MIIAIDGPSGAGKSTVSKAVARRLGFSCLDTGAMYRSIAWQALQNGVSLEDGEALGRIADMHEIGFSHEPGDPLPRRVSISGVDVTDAIRTAEIDRSVSAVAAAPAFARLLWPSSSASAARATTWWKVATSARQCSPRPS